MATKLTQSQAISLLKDAIGVRKATAGGFTNPYGAQCLAFIAWYLTDGLGYGKIMPGYNAIDILNKNPLKLPKPSTPRPGDVFFMDYWAYDPELRRNINYGHTGVVLEVTEMGIWSVDQNWFNASLAAGSPPAKVFHPFNKIVGYLRPSFAGGEGMDSINATSIIDAAFWALTGRKVKQSELDEYVPVFIAGNSDSFFKKILTFPEVQMHLGGAASSEYIREYAKRHGVSISEAEVTKWTGWKLADFVDNFDKHYPSSVASAAADAQKKIDAFKAAATALFA